MVENNKDKKFKLILGGSAGKVIVNNVRVEVVSDSWASLPVDVRVFEEDTFLVLTVDPVMKYTDEHPVKFMTRIMETKRHEPGSVVRKQSSWYAVVHDVDAEPVCSEEWIDKAYSEVLRLAATKGIAKLGIPLLGTVHGKFSACESLRLLVCHVKGLKKTSLKEILILAPHYMENEIRKILVEEVSGA